MDAYTHYNTTPESLEELETMREILTRLELDMAYVSEKVSNLNILLMHVETKESDFVTFISNMDPNLDIKALEFILLCVFLESEVKEVETEICNLQTESVYIRENLRKDAIFANDTLCDIERSLQQTLEQVQELKEQSTKFARNLLILGVEDSGVAGKVNDYIKSLNMGNYEDPKEEFKMQAKEHEKHVLRMLDKSLKGELDFEKRVMELTQTNDSLEREIRYAKKDAETALGRFYEAANESELLMEVCHELISQMGALEFNLKVAVERESELKVKLQEIVGKLEVKERKLVEVEEGKRWTARDIRLRTQMIKDLVMQMRFERERLHKQICSLKVENKMLVKRLKKKCEANMRNGEVTEIDLATRLQQKRAPGEHKVRYYVILLILVLFLLVFYQLRYFKFGFFSASSKM